MDYGQLRLAMARSGLFWKVASGIDGQQAVAGMRIWTLDAICETKAVAELLAPDVPVILAGVSLSVLTPETEQSASGPEQDAHRPALSVVVALSHPAIRDEKQQPTPQLRRHRD